MIDLFVWFDKSTKRKSNLSEHCTFCDIDFRKIVKHVNTKWLSLERATYVISKPITEIYLMFYQAALQAFVNFNKF